MKWGKIMKTKKLYIILSSVLVIAFIFTGCFGGSGTGAKDEVNIPEETKVETPKTEPVEEPDEESTENSGGANILTVTESSFSEDVLNSKGVVLVDFWASWCGPCLQLAPILEEVSAETGTIIAKVNVDENNNLASEYKISAIPAVFVFVDGVAKESIIGVQSKQTYLGIIDSYK